MTLQWFVKNGGHLYYFDADHPEVLLGECVARRDRVWKWELKISADTGFAPTRRAAKEAVEYYVSLRQKPGAPA